MYVDRSAVKSDDLVRRRSALCARRIPCALLTPRLNIEAHGFQGTIVRSWGAFIRATGVAGILLRYGNTAVAVDRRRNLRLEFARLIDNESNIAGAARFAANWLTGIQALLQPLRPDRLGRQLFSLFSKPPSRFPGEFAILRAAPRCATSGKLTDSTRGAGGMYRSRSNVANKLERDSRLRRGRGAARQAPGAYRFLRPSLICRRQ